MTDKTPIKGNVLADGEATGHAHRVEVPVFSGDRYDTRTFDAPAGTEVTHEEHAAFTLPPGKYATAQVLEYDHFREEARAVAD